MRKQIFTYKTEGLVAYLRDAARTGIMFARSKGGRAAGFNICVEPAVGSWEELNSYDYLKAMKGALAYAWDVGDNGIWLVADGTYWRPRDGRQLLFQLMGTVAAPIATVSSATSGTLAPTYKLTTSNKIPGVLIAPYSRLSIQADITRTGATATASAAVRLGTAGTSSDSAIYQSSMAATDGITAQINMSARFGTATTSFYTLLDLNQNAKGSGIVDKSANVNTGADMLVTVTITGANTADSFALNGISCYLEG